MDAQLGGCCDDYIGSDASRGMMMTYNADEEDTGYGSPPPALGIDMLSGAHGVMWVDDYFGPGSQFPYTVEQIDLALQSLWADDIPLTRGDYGFNPGNPDAVPTRWLFDGDPVTQAFWSNEDTDGQGTPVGGASRDALLSALPVTLAPGASHTVDVAIVFGQGADRLDSITRLRASSDLVQALYDDGSLFETTSGDLGLPPLAAPELVSPTDGAIEGQPTGVVLDWVDVSDASTYTVELFNNPEMGTPFATFKAFSSQFLVGSEFLPTGSTAPVHWRVTPANAAGDGPSSEVRAFVFAFDFDPDVLYLSNGQPAFLEVAGPGGADPCGDAADSTFGCDEAGGNAVYIPEQGTPLDANGTGVYAVTSVNGGPEGSLMPFAPNDYEIRFTADGSIAYHLFGEGPGRETHRVPFEVWDIGIVPLGADGVPGVNDPSDDRQIIPIVFSDGGAGLCRFQFGQITATDPGNPTGFALTDRIYAYYPTTTYADFDAVAAPLVDAAADGCYDDTANAALPGLIDTGQGRPIQRVVFADLAGSGSVTDLQGTVVRFHTTNPEPVADEAGPTASALALTVAPNPSRGGARVSFALPTAGAVHVRVVDVLGREVAVLADGVRSAGPHEVAMPRGLSAGVYVVTVEAGDARATRTLTIVR